LVLLLAIAEGVFLLLAIAEGVFLLLAVAEGIVVLLLNLFHRSHLLVIDLLELNNNIWGIQEGKVKSMTNLYGEIVEV